jgi:hypothetical protein
MKICEAKAQMGGCMIVLISERLGKAVFRSLIVTGFQLFRSCIDEANVRVLIRRLSKSRIVPQETEQAPNNKHQIPNKLQIQKFETFSF